MEDIGQNKEIEKQPMKPLPENNPRQPPSSRPPEQCSRCHSFNTRFGYYNNRSLSQPVYFCNSCSSKYYGIGGGSHKGVKGLIKSSHASGGGASCSSSLIGKRLSSIQEQVPEPQPPLPPPPPSSQLPLLSHDYLGLPIITPSLFKYLHRPPGFNQVELQPSQTSRSSKPLSSILLLAAMGNGKRALGLNQVQLNGGGIPDSNSAYYSVLQGCFGNNPTMTRALQFRQQLTNRSQQDAQMNMQMEDEGGNGKDDGKQPMKPPPKNNPPSQPRTSETPKQCPRCDSFNTKFCYYNNYSLSQPRYFCKSCRRYWTQGGILKDVPIGGGCRANKRGHASGSTVASCSRSSTGKGLTSVQEQVPPPPLPPLQPPLSASGLLSIAAWQDRDRSLLFNQLTLNGDGGGSNYANNLQEFSAGNPTTLSASLQQLQQLTNRSQDAEMKNIVRQPNRPLEGGLGYWTQMFINDDDDDPSSFNDFTACWDQITELGRLLDQPNNDIAGLDSAINNPNQLPDDDNDEDGVHLRAGYGPPPE